MAPSPSPCSCCSSPPSPYSSSQSTDTAEYTVSTEPSITINTSDFNIHVKEIIILGLIFLLLIYSVVIFLKRWSKNYRDINQVPYYSSQEHEEQFSGGKNLIMSFLLLHSLQSFHLCTGRMKMTSV